MFGLAVNKDHLIELFETLPISAQQSAYDFMKFLSIRNIRPDWDEIMKLDSVDEPLSVEEIQQLEESSDFMSWEDSMNELDLSTDTKS